MSAPPRPARPDGMEAGYLESASGPLFACYHPPRGPERRDAAVLFCDPFGSDRMNLHRAYRAFALHLAERGFACLRIDYPGTCDSAGHPRDPGHARSFASALHVGADFLATRTGASELGLFGAHLGGTVALAFAAERPDVKALALWGPHPSGSAFLRELAAFRALMPSNPNRVRPTTHRPGDEEAIGFLLTEETTRELRGLEPLARATPNVRAALLVQRNATTPVDRLAAHLRAGGVTVRERGGTVFDTNLLVDDMAPLPTALVDDVGAFFDEVFPARAPARAPAIEPALAPTVVLAGARATDAPVRESVVSFGADGALFGILTAPLDPAPVDRPAVLLVNGGHNHRAGINRNYTEWARAWAGSLGLDVLRFDIRGLGDSPPDPRQVGQVLYRDATRRDLADAMDLLAERRGARRFVAIGLCAGGYQAFHAALEDARIGAVVLLNPLRFERRTEETPLGTGELQSGAPLGHYARAALDPSEWRRFFAARRDPWPVLRRIARKSVARAFVAMRRVVSRARGDEAPPASWLSGAFLRLVERDCHVLLVFADDEPMSPLVEEQVGPDRARLEASGLFRVARVPDADHIFTPLASQERVEALLRHALARFADLAPGGEVDYDLAVEVAPRDVTARIARSSRGSPPPAQWLRSGEEGS